MDSFDRDSGLVYRETVVKQPKRNAISWEHRCAGNKPKYIAPLRGPESLYSIAMRSVVGHAATLEGDALKAIPEQLFENVWHEIRLHSRESFNVWKTFVEAKPSDQAALVHRTTISSPSKPLIDFYSDLTSPNFAWLTSLYLDDVSSCCAGDLKVLTTIDNLQHLMIRSAPINMRCQLDDHVIGYWSHRAESDGVLSRLKSIYIENAPDVSVGVLKSINNFPCLDLFCVVKTGIVDNDVKVFRKQGWFVNQRSTFLKTPEYGANKQQTRSRFKIHERFKSYVAEKERSIIGTTSGGPGVVQVNLRSHIQHGLDGFDRRAFCFDRDWTVDHRIPKKQRIEQRRMGEPPTKKPKLKSTKIKSLHTFFAET